MHHLLSCVECFVWSLWRRIDAGSRLPGFSAQNDSFLHLGVETRAMPSIIKFASSHQDRMDQLPEQSNCSVTCSTMGHVFSLDSLKWKGKRGIPTLTWFLGTDIYQWSTIAGFGRYEFATIAVYKIKASIWDTWPTVMVQLGLRQLQNRNRSELWVPQDAFTPILGDFHRKSSFRMTKNQILNVSKILQQRPRTKMFAQMFARHCQKIVHTNPWHCDNHLWDCSMKLHKIDSCDVAFCLDQG